jgi:hypothetical protein
MSTGYESKISDIVYLLDVASDADVAKLALMIRASVRKDGDRWRFLDEAGRELTLIEIHRRTQADPTPQRSVYNMWMTYAH